MIHLKKKSLKKKGRGNSGAKAIHGVRKILLMETIFKTLEGEKKSEGEMCIL